MPNNPVITACEECPLRVPLNSTRRSELLALVAHELRNPLSAIAMAVQVIRRTAVAPATSQAVAGIERQVVVMKRLIDDLTDVSRLVTNKITLQVQSLDVCSMCEQAIAAVQPLINAKHHTLKVECKTQEIVGDAVRLQQVISNLLSNATKFTPSGGNIALKVVPEGDGVCITVEDDGKGIEPETLEKIWDMFYQEETHAGSGLGIGLTLSKKLIEMHGGTITAYSQGKDKGTTFEIHLPVCPVPQVDRGVRVLIIDDNADHADAMKILLEMENFQVRVTYDGASGLEELVKFKPDVVFLDIGMPVMDGYEVISRISRVNKKPYIVAVTGFGQPGDKMRTKTAGFDEHLVKPPDERQIFEILERIAKEKA